MKDFTDEELKPIYTLIDEIKDCIIAMSLTDNVSEFVIYYNRALKKLDRIRMLNLNRLFSEEEK